LGYREIFTFYIGATVCECIFGHRNLLIIS
jgi:hypothetical protein